MHVDQRQEDVAQLRAVISQACSTRLRAHAFDGACRKQGNSVACLPRGIGGGRTSFLILWRNFSSRCFPWRTIIRLVLTFLQLFPSSPFKRPSSSILQEQRADALADR